MRTTSDGSRALEPLPPDGVRRPLAPTKSSVRTRWFWIGFAALLIAGTRLYSDNGALGTALMVASAIPLLHVVFGGRR